MIPLSLGRDAIERFLAAACRQLEGEWLLVGGAAAAVWFAPDRVTEGIDMMGMGGTMAERLRLMEVAAEHGLPIEAVNSAADFFIRRVPDWRSALEVLRASATMTLYRPSATLFLLLKLRRLSEVDLADCIALVAHCRAGGTEVDTARVLDALRALPPTGDAALGRRRDELARALV